MKLSQKKSRTEAALKYALLVLLIPLMLGASAFSISKSYGVLDLMPVNAIYQDTSKKTTTIKSDSPSKAIRSKKDTGKALTKPKVQNVQFMRPNVVTANSEKKVKSGEIVIDEPVVSEVRIVESVNQIKIVEPVQEIEMVAPVQEIKIVEPVNEIRIVEQKKLQKKKIGIPPPPPPVEPSNVRSIPRPKVESIKFPPPVVKPIKSNRQVPPPPPPVEPSKIKSTPRPKVENVKFPRPVVKPLKSKSNSQVPPPPPPVESKSIKGDPVKENGKSETIKGDPISE